jgi:hypothetical protein
MNVKEERLVDALRKSETRAHEEKGGGAKRGEETHLNGCKEKHPCGLAEEAAAEDTNLGWSRHVRVGPRNVELRVVEAMVVSEGNRSREDDGNIRKAGRHLVPDGVVKRGIMRQVMDKHPEEVIHDGAHGKGCANDDIPRGRNASKIPRDSNLRSDGEQDVQDGVWALLGKLL